MNNKIDFSKLFPDFTSISISPDTPQQLSALFVSALIIIFIVFLLISIKAVFSSLRQTAWVSTLLKRETQTSIASNRQELKEKSERVKHQGGHLWLEFDETLIEVEHNGVVKLHNTLDSHHFFNNATLARGITESRMLAAVPGFLTAVGVIGTFVGLQIGLSHLNIGNTVPVSEMKTGLAGVISGAQIAFMTSVWGVSLSVLFNFIEKWLESIARRRIHKLQTRIDNLFLRISAEFQLQRIADNSHESRESLQGLAEKIGEKMQESLLEATAGIKEGLESSLEKIMAPAINKLVDETADGNQKALESLVGSFLDRFGEQGDHQREAMDQASQNVSDALSSLNTSMSDFLGQLSESQSNSEAREQELIETMSSQVSQLVEQGEMQSQKITEFVENKLGGLSDLFQEREQAAMERDEKRQNAFVAQTSLMKSSTENLLEKIEESMGAQIESVQALINQGRQLQESANESISATVIASETLESSANELKAASKEMKLFGQNIRDAGNKLSGAVTEAVESTSELASQNQITSELIDKYRQQLLDDRGRIEQTIAQLQSLVDSADSSFDKMRDHQDIFLDGLKSNVSELSGQMTQLLTDYATQANAQTERHLGVWAEHTTSYAQQMNNAANALSNVVDEIEDKLGK